MALIDTLLEPDDLRRLSGQGSFERGSAYADAGRVISLEKQADRITARVDGTDSYRVELEAGEKGLTFWCDCPVGARGNFCKHCVAVGLAAVGIEDTEAAQPVDPIRRYLGSLSKESLIGLLLEEADVNDLLLERLTVRADIQDGGFNPDLARRKIHREIFPRGFVDYRDSREYAERLYQALDLLSLIISQAEPADAVALAEHACRSAEKAAGKIDDSDGFMSVVFERLQDLHHEACRRAGCEPEELAEKLFKLMMKTEYELFYDAVDRYADLLGDAGKERYANLVARKRERLPSLGSGDRRSESPDRFRLEYVSERLARRSGDIDQLVELWSRNLSRPFAYLQIAELLAEAGRQGEAIDWAERGLRAFPDHYDRRLVRFLAGVLGEWGEEDRAMDLVWKEFELHPSSENYELLKTPAEAAGNWDQTRNRALELLTQRVEATETDHLPNSYAAQVLVQVHLAEGDLTAALSAAKNGGCDEHTWMELGRQLAETDPGAAADIYRKRIEPAIEGKTKSAYRYAVRLIVRTRELLIESGRGDEFPALLEEVRATHSRKRTLMELLLEI